MDTKLFSRYPLAGTVMLQPTIGTPRTIKGDLLELSFKGFCAYADEPLEKERVFRFLLMSKEFDIRLSGGAKVVYSQPVVRKMKNMFRLSMEFTSVDSEQLRDIVLKISQSTEPKKDNIG